jgi:hypothetical protein
VEIYHWNRESGEYSGSSFARADPLEEDHFLIPANATEVEPPNAGVGQVAQWGDTGWQAVDDLRGTDYWLADGSAHTITEIGVSLPDGALDAPPPPELTASLIKTSAGLRIAARLKDEKTQRNMNALAAQLLNRKFSGSLNDADAATLALLDAAFGWVQAMQAKGRELVDALDEDYDDDGSWPDPPDGLSALVNML